MLTDLVLGNQSITQIITRKSFAAVAQNSTYYPRSNKNNSSDNKKSQDGLLDKYTLGLLLYFSV